GRMERQQLAVQALFHKLTRPEQLVRLPVLVMLSGKDMQTDMGPMELGGLVTAISTTDLKIRHLDGRPFDQGGVSYLDLDWPTQGETPAAPETTPGARRSFFLF
ncbi:MAG: LytR family transcriptional regulator, partial [Cyanobacteriota bacterium]|nr:LytR family transcriptional regulator [Cyanobacteriota bacterium]